jgi:hypothetical protein
VPDRIRTLLDYIVTNYVVVDEQKDIDLNANAVESGGDIESEKASASAREFERADALAEPFEQGLRAAWEARAQGRGEVALDDRDPAQNAMADALIQYLVSFGFAESTSTETEQYQYVYSIAVDWDKLAGVASDAGIDLAAALDARDRRR